ncbi:hypothetical protein ACFYMB_20120 [Micromonospora haikouensis]
MTAPEVEQEAPVVVLLLRAGALNGRSRGRLGLRAELRRPPMD